MGNLRFCIVLQSRSVLIVLCAYLPGFCETWIDNLSLPDCAPNVRKQRVHRAMCFFTNKDVAEGEELCINYVDVEDDVLVRRSELLGNWYFNCICKRCEAELADLKSPTVPSPAES